MENTVRKQTWDSLGKKVLMDCNMKIGKGIGEVLGPEADYTCYKDKFCYNFIDFINHKIICRKVEVHHALNGIGTLDT